MHLRCIAMNASRLFQTAVVLALIVSTGTFAPGLQASAGMAAESGFLNQLLLLLTFAAVIGLGLLGRGVVFRGAASEWLVGLVLLWSALSVFWSVRPEATMVRSFALTLTMLVATFAIQALGRRDFIALAGRALLFVLLVNILVVFFQPQIGIAGFPTDGAWRGLFTQKNVLGRIALIGFLIGLFHVVSPSRRERAESLALLFLSAAVIVGSRSATAAIVLLLVLGFSALVLILRHARAGIGVAALAVGLGGLLAAAVTLLSFDRMAAAIGRSATLSGRLPLWDELLRIGGTVPLLGKGYGAFWFPGNEDVALLWSRLGWMPVQAHNGYIEIFLQLGAVGLVLAVLMLVGLGCSSFLRFMRGGDGTWLLAFILAVTIAMLALTEAVLLAQNNIFTILLVALLPGRNAVAEKRLPHPEEALEDPVSV